MFGAEFETNQTIVTQLKYLRVRAPKQLFFLLNGLDKNILTLLNLIHSTQYQFFSQRVSNLFDLRCLPKARDQPSGNARIVAKGSFVRTIVVLNFSIHKLYSCCLIQIKVNQHTVQIEDTGSKQRRSERIIDGIVGDFRRVEYTLQRK